MRKDRSSSDGRWATGPIEPEEREQILNELLRLLQNLDDAALVGYWRSCESRGIEKEILAFDMNVKPAHPPNSFIDNPPRKTLERCLAECIIYVYELEWLIDEKRAEGNQLRLDLCTVKNPRQAASTKKSRNAHA